METLRIPLIVFVVSIMFATISHSYDIVQITGTPNANENNPHSAILGSTVYAAWDDGAGNLYFDKSLDLGNTWGAYRKMIDTAGCSAKVFVAKDARIFVSYSTYYVGQNNFSVLKSSDDGGETFYDVAIPEDMRNSGMAFAINKSGNIIYGVGQSKSLQKMMIIKSFDGGRTFSEPKETAVSSISEISEDGKYVYVFCVGTIYLEGYRKTVPFLTRSTDYGETFENPKPLMTGHHWSYDLCSAIGENGDIYLAWGHDSYGIHSILFLQSLDHGVSFLGGTISAGGWDSSHSCYTSVSSPSITLNENGIVHVVFLKYITDFVNQKNNIEVCYNKKEKEFPGGPVKFSQDREIWTMPEGFQYLGMPKIVVTPEGDRACAIWSACRPTGPQFYSRDLYCATFPTNESPEINPPIGNKEVNEGNLLDFIVSAVDPDDDELICSVTNLPQGAIFDSQERRFIWTPDYSQAGVYNNIKFAVSDGTLKAEETITITVNNTNRAPIFDAEGNRSINEGNSLRFNVFAADPDGDAVTYSAINLPQGAIFNPQTKTFSWTPSYAQQGSYVVTFVASDGDLSAGETIVIKVNNVARPDLTAGAITFTPQRPKKGQAVTFKAVISNKGDKAAGKFDVGLDIDKIRISSAEIIKLLPGKTATVDFKWKATLGTHKAKVTADVFNKVLEQNETNNAAETQIIVQ